MADYMNPFAGSLLPETVPNNPFASRYNQLDNREQMAPFLNMEKQRQQTSIDQGQYKWGEFTSPEAVESRKTELTTKTATAQAEAAEAQQKLRLMPQQEQLKLVELRNKMMGAQAEPVKALFKAFGDAALILEKTPEQMRPAAWANIVGRWAQEHPGIPIPEKYRQYSPELMKETSDVRLAQIMDPKHVQEMAKVDKQKEWEIRKAQISAGATIGAAKIHEQGATARQQAGFRENAKQTPGQFKVSNMKVWSNPQSTPEQMEVAEQNLMSFASEQMGKIWKDDSVLDALAVKAINDPNAAKLYDTRKAKLFEDYLVDQGIRVRVVAPDGKTKGTIAKYKLSGALAAGYKEVK